MNILFVCFSLKKGGAERVISNLCNSSISNDNNITILTCVNDSVEYNINKDITIKTLDNKIGQYKENKVYRFLRRRNKLKKIVDTIKPDIIISFLPEPSMITLSIKRLLNCPVIISVRNDPHKEYSNFLYNIIMKKLYPKADGYVFQTKQAKDYFEFSEHIISKACIIPNPINEDFVKEPFSGERKKIIVAVGRLEKQKNYPLLINAFERISKEFPEYKLKIYGEGNERKQIEQMISNKQLNNSIELCGKKNNIKDLIYDSTAFVMTSTYEGMPNALMEAMALGLPVISTDCPCGGPAFLIDNDENGILVDVNDVESLVEAIRKIIVDKEFASKISLNANKISERLSPKEIHKTWGEYIKKIYDERENNG